MENTNRTELQSLGEFGLIRRINAGTTLLNPESVRGIGDDAAVIDVGSQYLLLSTDMLVEGVHFDLSYVPLKHLGYKSVAVNVSDIAAMKWAYANKYGFSCLSTSTNLAVLNQ